MNPDRKKGHGTLPRLTSLRSVKFVAMDDGSFVSPAMICVDLSEGKDLSNRARALPAHLQKYWKLFEEIGSKSALGTGAPDVTIHALRQTDLCKALPAVYNNKQLADVILVGIGSFMPTS